MHANSNTAKLARFHCVNAHVNELVLAINTEQHNSIRNMHVIHAQMDLNNNEDMLVVYVEHFDCYELLYNEELDYDARKAAISKAVKQAHALLAHSARGYMTLDSIIRANGFSAKAASDIKAVDYSDDDSLEQVFVAFKCKTLAREARAALAQKLAHDQ